MLTKIVVSNTLINYAAIVRAQFSSDVEGIMQGIRKSVVELAIQIARAVMIQYWPQW